MCVADIVVPPGGGAPPHSHRAEDELFYVIDGSFELTVAGKTYPLPTGATAYVPRGTAHAFRNVGDADGRLFDMHTPGGFERFFFACDATAASAAPPDEAGMRAFLDKHGMDVPEPVSA
jgi:uncharacterized cupin superfamily protein